MTQVIINDILPLTHIIASGGQTIFDTNWTANVASDVVVYQRPGNVAADDATQQLLTSAYTVSFVGGSLIVRVTLLTPASLGDVITINRQTPVDRLNLYSNTNFTPSMLNNDFGIVTLVEQQAQLVNEQVAPRYNYSELVTVPKDLILPLLGPNQVWAMNSANTAIEAFDVSTFVGGITLLNTGLGLTGGPITTSGTISFDVMPAHTFWGNITGSTALPTQVNTSYFLAATNNLSDLTNKPLARTNLGVEIGTDVEAWSPALDSIAGLSTSANQLLRTTASNTYATISALANATLITSAGSVPSLSQTLPTAVQSNITQLGAQTQALDMNSHQINNVVDPTNPQDAATRAYVLAQTVGSFLPLAGGTMSGAINMGNNQINAMADPSSAQDAVTLSYLNTALALKLSLSGGTMTGAINMGSHFITNLLDPVNPQDAATKNYVDLIATGFAIQPAVAVATTANLNGIYVNGASGIGATLTNAGALAALVIDGYAVNTNDRILVKDQASTLENGIWSATNVGSGAVAWILTRSTDYDQPSEIQPGDLVIVNNGTVNGGSSWVETASVSAIGTDPILFSQFTFSATAVLLKALNLSDVANTVTAFNNISPTTTKGDLIVDDGTNDVRLAVGMTDGQILQVSSGAATGLAYSTATYPVTTTVNQILYSSATNVIGGISSLAGGVLVTDNLSVPSMLTNPGAANRMLLSANAAIPTWSTSSIPSSAGATANKVLLSDGTNYVLSTPTFPNASAASGKFIQSDGTNWIASTPTLPTSASTAGKILQSDGTNFVQSTPTYPSISGTAGKVVISDGTNNVYSTPTFPNASATTRKIIVSDGTNWIASTETYAVPGASGNVLTSDGTNWTSAAAAGVTLLTNKGDLFGFSTINARVPVVAGNGKVLQVDSAATVGLSYSTPTYPSASGTSRKMLVADGTNIVYSTETWAVPGSSGNILKSDGTNWTSAAPAAILPAGTMFNLQSTNLTTTTSIASSSYTDVSGLSVAITPTSATNKVLVRAVVLISTNAGSTAFAQLVRGSTAIGVGTAAGSRTQAGGVVYAGQTNHGICVVMEFLDSPATTSATTYKVQALSSDAATIQINRGITDTNSAGFERSSSTITVCEVVV